MTTAKMEIARDGFLCYQGSTQYLFYSKNKGFECQYNGAGIKIGPNGMQKLVNGEWNNF